MTTRCLSEGGEFIQKRIQSFRRIWHWASKRSNGIDKIKKINLDDNTDTCINIADQLEPPFYCRKQTRPRRMLWVEFQVHIIDKASDEVNRELKMKGQN